MLRKGGVVLRGSRRGTGSSTTCRNNWRHQVTKRRNNNVVRRDQNDIQEILGPIRESDAAKDSLKFFSRGRFLSFMRGQTSLHGIPSTVIFGLASISVPAAALLAIDRNTVGAEDNYHPISLGGHFVQNVASAPSFKSSLFYCVLNAAMAGAFGVGVGAASIYYYFNKFVDLTRIGVPHTRPFFRHLRTQARSTLIYGAVTGGFASVLASLGFTLVSALPHILHAQQVGMLNKTHFRGSFNLTPSQEDFVLLTLAQLGIGMTCFAISARISPFGFFPAIAALFGSGTALSLGTRLFGLEGETGLVRSASRNIDAWQTAHPEATLSGGSVVSLAVQYETRERRRRAKELWQEMKETDEYKRAHH